MFHDPQVIYWMDYFVAINSSMLLVFNSILLENPDNILLIMEKLKVEIVNKLLLLFYP